MRNLLALLLFVPSLCLAQSVTLPYNPDANADSTIGCANPAACNYNPTATEDDGSCQLPPTIGWSTDTSICAVPFVLDAGQGFNAYLWNTGDTAQTITKFQEGQYSVEVTETGTGDSHSLQFDGVDDYVDIPDIDITGSGPFTLCASARLLGETGTDFYNILSSGENDSGLLQWGINDNDLRMAFYHADINKIESNVPIDRFEWYHTAVVYDGTDLILYLNAEEVQRQSVTLTLTQSVRFIGQWQVDSDIIAAREPWHGQLDHVGIWNTTLSQDQIAEQMSCPSSPEPDGLMAHWNFETDTGNAPSDNGTVVTSGTIVGAEYSTLTPENLCTGCSSTASINVTVDFDCLYCGEGTEWDEETLQCIATNNGPMPSCGEGTVWDPVNEECIVAIPADINFDGCVTVNDLLELLAVHGTCPPYPEWPEEPTDTTWSCGDSLTYWDYDYATVLIGDQCWFAENLRSGLYSNGDTISLVLDNDHWLALGNDSTGGTAFYDNNECNGSVFGALYNGFAVLDTRSLCPYNWGVPSDLEWQILETQLGMPINQLTTETWRGNAEDVGQAMKVTTADSPPWNGTNTSLWNGLPAGYRHPTGTFNSLEAISLFWSRDLVPGANSLYAYLFSRQLSSPQTGIKREREMALRGFSVRCLKDAE